MPIQIFDLWRNKSIIYKASAAYLEMLNVM